MSARAAFRALRPFQNGTAVAFNRAHGLRLTVRVEVVEGDGEPRYRFVLHDATSVFELWESTSLHTLRKIACGYYPALARFFGPARVMVGL